MVSQTKKTAENGIRAQTAPDEKPASSFAGLIHLVPESIPEAFVTFNTNGQITGWNPAAERSYGWKSEEVLGKSLDNFLQTIYTGDSSTNAKKQATETGIWCGRVTQMCKDGTRIQVLSTVIVIKDPEGHPQGFFALNRNLGLDSQALETDLRKINEQMQLVHEAVGMGVWQHDLSTGLVYLDERARSHYGFEDAVVTIGDVLNRVHPEDIKRLQSEIEAATHAEGSGRFTTEYRVIQPDGRVCWLAVGVRVWFEEHEGVRRASVGFGTSQDITSRKQAQEKLLTSARTLKLFIDNAPAAIAMFDREMRYLAVSRRFIKNNSLEGQELIGRSHYDVFPEIPQYWKDVHQRCLAGAIEMAEEDRFPRADGTWDWVRWEIHPWYEQPGEIGGLILFSELITARKQAELQIQLQLQRMGALNKIDRAINASLDIHLSLDILLRELLSQLGVDAAAVLLLNSPHGRLEYIAGKGFQTPAIRQSSLRLGEGLAGQVGLERKVMHVPNLEETGGSFVRAMLLADEGFVEYFGIPLIAKSSLKGVLEIFNRSHLKPDLEWVNYLETLGGQAAIAIDNAQLFEEMQRSHRELVVAYDATIAGWSHAMDLRDKETEGHTRRVTEITLTLAEKMGFNEAEMVHIRRGALLHDIGKLGVPDEILFKPGPLTEAEWAIMRRHPTHAYHMLLPIHYLRPALDIPYCHHEKWDGTGYPRGLRGEQIPLAARIFAVVDVWDALRSARPYRESWSEEESRQYIIDQTGKHFDPQVVKVFLKMITPEG